MLGYGMEWRGTAVEAGSATVRLGLLRLGEARLVKAVVVCCVPVRLDRVC